MPLLRILVLAWLAWFCLLLALGVAALSVSSRAHAAERCLVIGDSIASAQGLGGQFPECANHARVGAPTSEIKSYPAPAALYFTIISAGSNDPDSPNLAADLAKLRSRVSGARVVWILPMNSRARQHVALEAALHHDWTIVFAPAPDGIHPRSYQALGAVIREKLRAGDS